MVEMNKARQALPEKSRGLFDDIVTQRVLGASKHIHMIGEMIEAIALEGKKNRSSVDAIIANIAIVTQYFIDTRGEASQAISNAIRMMIKGINDVRDLETPEAVNNIIENKNSYLQGAKEAIEQVVEYGVNVAKTFDRIMVFDYSSTVERFLERLGEEDGGLTVVIPESRSIDGGYPFVKACLNAGHNIKFIPDAAIMYFLKRCDAAFIGAETFYPNGTVFNTTGSDIVGLVCKEFHIPLYVLTPLIKVDIRSMFGYEKALVENDLTNRLASTWSKEEKEITDFTCPELLAVEPEYITAIISEKGIIPASQLFTVSTKFYHELKGE